jgi:hypothetical protein
MTVFASLKSKIGEFVDRGGSRYKNGTLLGTPHVLSPVECAPPTLSQIVVDPTLGWRSEDYITRSEPDSKGTDYTKKLPHELKQEIAKLAVGPLHKGNISETQINTHEALAHTNRSWRLAAYDIKEEDMNLLVAVKVAVKLYQQGLRPKIFQASWDGHEACSWEEKIFGQSHDIEKLGPLIHLLSPKKQANLIMDTTTLKTAQNPSLESRRGFVWRLSPFSNEFTPENRRTLAQNAKAMIRPGGYHDGDVYWDDSDYRRLCRDLES